MAVIIEEMDPGHWQQVRQIYQEGIETGLATFETERLPWEKWDQGHLPFARLVAISEGFVQGWAALSAVSTRAVYSGVAEVSVYVSGRWRGQGVGSALLKRLVDDSEKNGIWTLQAGIFPDNLPSIALHKSCDFRVVGTRKRIGKLDGIWRDTVLLERRSEVVGIA